MRISNRKLMVFTAVIFALCAAVTAYFWFSGSGGTQVVVTVDGKVWGSYDLYADKRVVVGPEDGSWHNTLEIKDGRAAIVESDCDNQICVHTPALREDLVGMIVCLPHSLVVELREPF